MGRSRRRGLRRRRAGRIPRRQRRYGRRRELDRKLLGYALATLAVIAAVGIALVFTVFHKQSTYGVRVLRFTVVSGAVHRTLVQTVLVPPGTDGAHRPVLVFLHGAEAVRVQPRDVIRAEAAHRDPANRHAPPISVQQGDRLWQHFFVDVARPVATATVVPVGVRSA